MPLHGLVHDSPLITAVQQGTRRGRRYATASDQADQEWEAVLELYDRVGGGEGLANFWRKLGFKEEWLAEPYRKK